VVKFFSSQYSVVGFSYFTSGLGSAGLGGSTIFSSAGPGAHVTIEPVAFLRRLAAGARL
jgi:hypothetical protein